MRNLDAVVSDLEWHRLRRRIAMRLPGALLFNGATWAVIAFLKLVGRS